ncbi:hypothetical protein ACPPVS_17780 [Cellulomonas sp. McL0617]|uniref:hypothetical protein n=1 Tax=Cellulomonas sp. McL0617 TaxID=3415675 RepID=UPI003CEBC13E
MNEFRDGVESLTRDVAAHYRSTAGISVQVVERAARRRRRRRESLLAAASFAVVAVLGLGATALVERPAPTPPVGHPTSSATPTATPTPTPSPTPSPSPTTTRTLATKDAAAEPDGWAMTDATWDSVGPGWALTVFSTMAYVPDDDNGHFDPAGTQALFLVAPDGTTYRVLSLPTESGEAQVMWWDAARGKAWLFYKGIEESWGAAEVDLRTGDQGRIALPTNVLGADPAPVRQLPDGRMLWADADPYFGVPLGGLFWQQTDGSFSTIAGPTQIEGDAWLDPTGARLVYLAPDAAGGGVSLVTYELQSGATQTVDLGSPPQGIRCSVQDVREASVLVSCDDPDTFGQLHYDVSLTGDWHTSSDSGSSPRLVHDMLVCGASELPWSPGGRVLPAPLAAQGWYDALVLPAVPGAPLSIPKAGACGE